LSAAVESTSGFIEKVCGLLVEVWRTRRANPAGSPQPKAQWPKIRPPEPPEFLGYEPSTVEFDPSEFHTAPEFVQRLRAASLEGAERLHWQELDGE